MLSASTSSSTPIIGSDKAYTCNICRQTLSLTGPLIIGETPEQHQARVVQLLSEHLGQNHQREMGSAMLTGNGLAGLVILYHFKHNDEIIKELIVQNAAGVRRFTSKYLGRWRVTDAMIEKIVRQSSPSDAVDATLQCSTVIEMLKSMRDQIDEAPEEPGATLLR